MTLIWIWLTAPRPRTSLQQAQVLQAVERHINVGRIVFAHPALEVTDDRERVEATLGLELACWGNRRPTLRTGRRDEDIGQVLAAMMGRECIAQDRAVVGGLFLGAARFSSSVHLLGRSGPSGSSGKSFKISAAGACMRSSSVTSSDGGIG